MPGIFRIGGDPELEHTGARHHPFDEIDLRLVDIGHDHFQLINAVATDGDFLLAARIHAPAHGRHQLVHIDRGRPSSHLVLKIDGLGPRPAARQPHPCITEVELFHTLEKGLAGGSVSGLEPHGDAVVGHPRHRSLPTILAGEQLFDPADTIIDLPGRLPGRIDLVDQDHAALEVDTQPRRPAEPRDHGPCRQRHQHRGQTPPHVGGPQPLRKQPRHQNRHGHREQGDAPDRPRLPPPLSGPRRNGGAPGRHVGGLGKQLDCAGETVHSVLISEFWFQDSVFRIPAKRSHRAPWRCSTT